MQEGLQAIEATKRLAEILSTHPFTIKRSDEDRYGRVLALSSLEDCALVGHAARGHCCCPAGEMATPIGPAMGRRARRDGVDRLRP